MPFLRVKASVILKKIYNFNIYIDNLFYKTAISTQQRKQSKCKRNLHIICTSKTTFDFNKLMTI